jgi:Flp pilus assembly pilin Flp
MKKLRNSFVYFLVGENGATAVEYAYLTALVVVGCMASLLACGNGVSRMLTQIMAKMAAN